MSVRIGVPTRHRPIPQGRQPPGESETTRRRDLSTPTPWPDGLWQPLTLLLSRRVNHGSQGRFRAYSTNSTGRDFPAIPRRTYRLCRLSPRRNPANPTLRSLAATQRHCNVRPYVSCAGESVGRKRVIIRRLGVTVSAAILIFAGSAVIVQTPAYAVESKGDANCSSSTVCRVQSNATSHVIHYRGPSSSGPWTLKASWINSGAQTRTSRHGIGNQWWRVFSSGTLNWAGGTCVPCNPGECPV